MTYWGLMCFLLHLFTLWADGWGAVVCVVVARFKSVRIRLRLFTFNLHPYKKNF